MRHKLLLLLFLAVVFSPYALEAKTGKTYFKKIFELTEQDYSLGAQIIDRLDFKVSDRQFLRKGDTLKYVLEGSDEAAYLFKTYKDYEEENPINNIFATKFSILCDIPTNDDFVMWLPINWKSVYGDIQKVVKDIRDFNYDFPPVDHNWLKYYLFRWLLDDPSPDFYLLPEDSIINIDLDKIRDTSGMSFDDFDYGKFTHLLTICLKANKIEESFKEALSFVDYVESLPEDKVIDLFGPYAFYDRVNAFNVRKKALKAEFRKYFFKKAKENGVKVSFDTAIADSNAYAKKVLSKLNQRIKEKKKILNTLSKEPVLKNNLELITSQNSISFIDFSKAPINKLNLLINQRIESLKTLRKDTANIYERLALSLYINRYRQFLPYFRYGILPLENVQLIFSLHELDVRAVEANLMLVNIGSESTISYSMPEGLTKYSLDDYYEDNIRDKTSQENKNSEWNYIMNGNCYLFKLELEKALNEYDKVVKLRQCNQGALFLSHLLKGYIYELNKECLLFGQGWQAAKAEEEFRMASKINPDSKSVKLNLQVINWLKESDENIFDEANSLDAEGNYIMGLIFIIKKQYGIAEKYIEKAKVLGFDKGLLKEAYEGIGE